MNHIVSNTADKNYIQNLAQLIPAAGAQSKQTALDIVQRAISAADPELAARRHVQYDGATLAINKRTYSLQQGQRIFVIGAGKASFPIAKVLDEVIGAGICQGYVTCKRGQNACLDHITIAQADHPLPTQASQEAVQATLELLRQVRPDDIVIACFTGGSSALFTSFADGISLNDARTTYQQLLTCGANIVEINAVRKHISKIKGGHLAQYLPRGTHLINLTVSDVIGERMDCITCPSVPDNSTFQDAQQTLTKYQLWETLPRAVTAHIQAALPENATTDSRGFSHIDRQDVLLVTTDAACLGAAQAARKHGYAAHILSTQFEGESSALARNMLAIAREIALYERPFTKPCVLIAGGETTVSISGSAGVGGPNQEFAVCAAIELQNTANIVAIAIDTDGTDGPTIHAGGLADNQTFALANAKGIDLHEALRTHNVTPALEVIHQVITTGNTGTNVNDLKLIIIDK